MKRSMKAVLMTMIVMLAAMALSGCSGKTISLNDYVTVEFSGYEGYATAQIVYDTDALENDCANISVKESAVKKALEEEEEDWGFDLYDDEDIEWIIESMSASDYISDVLAEAELDQTEGLSAGDTVTVSWDISESTLEEIKTYFGVSVTFEDQTFTVEEGALGEAEAYDPFADGEIELVFSGISGSATLEITNNSKYSEYITYTADESYDLSTGDVITVTAKGSDELMQACGVVLTQTEKEYTVEGLDSYVTELSDIPDETMEKMKAQAEDVMAAAGASDIIGKWSDESVYEGMEYVGCYFLVSKSSDTDWFESYNILDLVYEVTVQNGDLGTITYYNVFTYNDILQLSDGTLSVDLDSCSMTTHSYWPDGTSYYYNGYQTLESAFSDYVTANVDSYTYESTIEE